MTAAVRDQRLCRTIRRGLVRTTAASKTSSTMGIANRGPNSNDSGSNAYATMATNTAKAGGSRFSPAAVRRCDSSSSSGSTGATR